MWSLCTGLQALSYNFTTLLLPRIGLGIFEAGTGPPSYSLIADFYPPEKRTTANSVYSLGIYIGQALSSLTTLLIDAFGWKNAFIFIAGISICFAIIGFLVIKEPKRGRFDVKVETPDDEYDERGNKI
jgi:MFS family permease